MIEIHSIPDFHSIFTTYRWKPIYGCPGRYILKEEKNYTIPELVGIEARIQTFFSPKAKDKVCIVVLQNGGLISYMKNDGEYVHTLNTSDGFSRKLAMLEIDVIKSKEE